SCPLKRCRGCSLGNTHRALCIVQCCVDESVWCVCVCVFQSEGKRLGLVGWVQNTDAGTVRGQLQGLASKVQQMQSSCVLPE
uniref:Acylphosphatase-1 n=1 Tax=Cyprinus carpio TaxID=7962 RepID=A0A8C1KHW5_CYPCA